MPAAPSWCIWARFCECWRALSRLFPCVSKTAYVRCAECRDERTCGIRMVMKDVRDATARILDQTSLADILKRVELAVEGKDALNYAI